MSGPVPVQAAGLLFDNDGVLVSSIGSANRCWREWAAHYNVPGAHALTIEHGVRATELIARLVPGLDIAEGLRRIEDLEIADVAGLEVLPGVRELLESLPLERWAIVTSATQRLLRSRLLAARLPIPDRLVTAEMVERGKPDPEPYRRGAEMVGAAPADCLVVEDAPAGIGAGLAAGCRVLGVLGTHNLTELRAAGANWVVQTLRDVHAEVRPEGLALTMQTL